VAPVPFGQFFWSVDRVKTPAGRRRHKIPALFTDSLARFSLIATAVTCES